MIWHFERNDVIKICDGIILGFYTVLSRLYMWQCQVEIKHYSIAYFDRITVFEALQSRTSVGLGLVHAVYMCQLFTAHMSPTCNGSRAYVTALQKQ